MHQSAWDFGSCFRSFAGSGPAFPGSLGGPSLDRYASLQPSPDPPAGTLIRLRGLYTSLKAALRKVADVVLARPELAIYASVNEVAAAAGVSEATVMRLCRLRGSGAFRISRSRWPGNW